MLQLNSDKFNIAKLSYLLLPLLYVAVLLATISLCSDIGLQSFYFPKAIINWRFYPPDRKLLLIKPDIKLIYSCFYICMVRISLILNFIQYVF